MNETRYPTSEATTVKVMFAIEQRWNERQPWMEVRWVSPSHTPEKAAQKAARYRAEIDRGEYEGLDSDTQPQLRIVQRVSEWTPLALEV